MAVLASALDRHTRFYVDPKQHKLYAVRTMCLYARSDNTWGHVNGLLALLVRSGSSALNTITKAFSGYKVIDPMRTLPAVGYGLNDRCDRWEICRTFFFSAVEFESRMYRSYPSCQPFYHCRVRATTRVTTIRVHGQMGFSFPSRPNMPETRLDKLEWAFRKTVQSLLDQFSGSYYFPGPFLFCKVP